MIEAARGRVSFFEAQARHRRAAAAWSVCCAATAAVVGVVASAILTPFLLVVAAAAARLLHELYPLPEALWSAFRGAASILDRTWAAAADRRVSSAELGALAAGLAFLLVPGMSIVLALWWRLRRALFRRGLGIGVAAAGRPPRASDAEERQLRNLVEEMAVAAGMAAPDLVLVDGEPPNAAVVGAADGRVRLVVHRSTLDALSRDQTQALVGHLLASAANGDPRIGIETLAVAQTFGLLTAVLEAPLNATARRNLRRIVRQAVSPARAGAADHERVASELAAALEPGTISETGDFLDAADRPGTGRLARLFLDLRGILLAPLFGVILVVKLALLLVTMLVVGPVLWAILRHRRYLADATTIQLTRNPAALAAALAVLDREGAVPLAADWAAHLHVVGRAARGRDSPEPGAGAERPLFLAGAHPPVRARLERLRALGAGDPVAEPEPAGRAAGPSAATPPPLAGVWRVLAVAVTVVIVGVLGVYLAGALAYLLGVAFLFGIGVLLGTYAGALWLVERLIP